MKLIVPRQLPCQPKEWLFKVVVRFGRNIIVLQILLSVEGDLLGFDLTILDLYLVSREHDGDVFTDTSKVTMPVGNVFVGDTGGNVEHDDGTLSLDVVSIAQSTEFLLSSSIPHVEFNRTSVSVEDEGMDLDSEGGNVFLLKLSRQVPFDKSGFAYSTVTDEDELKFWHFLLRSLVHHC